MSEPYWVPLGAAGGVLDPAGIGTSLPASPVDGQVSVLVDSLTDPTFAWYLRYIAAKVSNKWVCIGNGMPMISQVAAAEGRGSTSYGDCATIVSLTVPVAGIYDVEYMASMQNQAAVTLQGFGSLEIGATAASDLWAFVSHMTSNLFGGGSRKLRTGQLAAGTVLTAKYRCNAANTVNFSNRELRVTPVAIGG